MLQIAFKLWLMVVFGALGLWLWRLADRWNETGEIPKEWVESRKPRPWHRSDQGFRSFIIWQRIIAILVWFFAALFALSIIFQFNGMLP